MADFFTSTPLPPGWRVKSDPDGKIYYENTRTGETSWTRPASSTNNGNGQSTPLPQQPQANPYSPTFNNVGGARGPSIGSAIWSSLMQDLNKGFMQNLAVPPPAAAPTQPQWPIFPFPGVTDQVYINGEPMSKVALLRLKLLGYQPPPNQYW